MRKVFLVSLFLSWSVPALAQGVTGQGNLFAGIGTAGGASVSQFGGGAEVLFKGFGPSVELGLAAPPASLSNFIGLFSLNGVYHVQAHGEKPRAVRPFVTGGYSLAFREGSQNLWNLGGGIDWWAGKKTALRFEARDYFLRSSGGYEHMWGIRAGVVFK